MSFLKCFRRRAPSGTYSPPPRLRFRRSQMFLGRSSVHPLPPRKSASSFYPVRAYGAPVAFVVWRTI